MSEAAPLLGTGLRGVQI